MKRNALIILTIVAALSAGIYWKTSEGKHEVTEALLDRKFTVAELQNDLNFLRGAIRDRHPRHRVRQLNTSLDQAFDEALKAFDKPLGRREAFLVFGKLNPHFQDAHTVIMPLKDETNILQEKGGNIFPLRVKLDRYGKILLNKDWVRSSDGRKLANKTQISEINGVPARKLVEHMASFSHGETAGLRKHMLGLMFDNWLYAIYGWEGAFKLVIIENGAPVNIVIKPQDVWTSSEIGGEHDLPMLTVLDNGVAYLKIPSFDVDEYPQAYNEKIDAAFTQMRTQRTSKLIIDIRGNTGGQSEAGAQVIKYLVDRPVNQVSSAIERLNESNNGIFGHLGKPGEIRVMDLSKDGQVYPVDKQKRFVGKTILLVDAMSYSASILFATSLQDHKIATLVGEPTGGFGNQTGNMEAVYLPNTRFLVYIPAREFIRPNGDRKMASVMPDVVVQSQSTDISIVDSAMETALQLVTKKSL